jgi:hypothetical protein
MKRPGLSAKIDGLFGDLVLVTFTSTSALQTHQRISLRACSFTVVGPAHAENRRPDLEDQWPLQLRIVLDA